MRNFPVRWEVAWISGTFGLNKPDVSLGPLRITGNQPSDNEIHHLLHRAGASVRLPGRIQR